MFIVILFNFLGIFIYYLSIYFPSICHGFVEKNIKIWKVSPACFLYIGRRDLCFTVFDLMFSDAIQIQCQELRLVAHFIHYFHGSSAMRLVSAIEWVIAFALAIGTLLVALEMAPKMSKDDKSSGYDADDTSCDALIALLMALDISDDAKVVLPAGIAGSSTDTLEEIQKRMKEKKTDITKRAGLIDKLVKEKNKDGKIFQRTIKAVVNVGGKSFVMEIEIGEDTWVGSFRQSVIRAINKYLKKNGMKKLPKAVARRLTLSSGKDKDYNGRKLVKSLDMDNIAIFFPADAPKFNVPTTDDLKGTVVVDDAEDDDADEGDDTDEDA